MSEYGMQVGGIVADSGAFGVQPPDVAPYLINVAAPTPLRLPIH